MKLFWKSKEIEKEFIHQLVSTKNQRGWTPYIRVAFEQKKSLLLDYFQHPQRKEIENKVFRMIRE